MNTNALKIFRSLLKNGCINKEDDPTLFSMINDTDVSDALDILQQEFDCSLYRTNGRIYLIPNQTNELFLQGRADYKRSVGTDAKLDDIYLYNYIAIFILHSMFGGTGSNLKTYDFFKVSDMINNFTDHCQQIRTESANFESASEKYSMDFMRLADKWLSKRSEIENKAETKYGAIMKVIRKFKDEELLLEKENDIYEATRKLNDLMPHFLDQQRVKEVNSIFERSSEQCPQ